MNEPFYTRDGVVITPGMTVYVKDEVYPNPPNAQIVDSVSEDGKKILFRNPGPDDYHGARVNGVFAFSNNCVAAIAKTRVILDLTTSDAHLILFALAHELKRVRSDLATLKIAKERDLTPRERMVLPSLVSLHCKTREEIAEEINPWISLEMDYMYLIDILEQAKAKTTDETDQMWEDNKKLGKPYD